MVLRAVAPAGCWFVKLRLSLIIFQLRKNILFKYKSNSDGVHCKSPIVHDALACEQHWHYNSVNLLAIPKSLRSKAKNNKRIVWDCETYRLFCTLLCLSLAVSSCWRAGGLSAKADVFKQTHPRVPNSMQNLIASASLAQVRCQAAGSQYESPCTAILAATLD